MAEATAATSPVKPIREPITDIESARHEITEMLPLPEGQNSANFHIDLTGEDSVRYAGLDLERVQVTTTKGNNVSGVAVVFNGANDHIESRALFIHPVNGFFAVTGDNATIKNHVEDFRKNPEGEQFQLSQLPRIDVAKAQAALSQATIRLLDRVLMQKVM